MKSVKKKCLLKVVNFNKHIKNEEDEYWCDYDYNNLMSNLLHYVFGDGVQKKKTQFLEDLFIEYITHPIPDNFKKCSFPLLRLIGWWKTTKQVNIHLLLDEVDDRIINDIHLMRKVKITNDYLQEIGKKYDIKRRKLNKAKYMKKIIYELALILKELKGFYDHCKKYEASYFWPPRVFANNRRKAQKDADYKKTEIIADGNTLEFYASADVSCRNFYFYKTVYKNGKKTNLKSVKTALDKTFNLLLMLLLYK